MTSARAYHSATLLPSGAVLVAGGANFNQLNSAELYDPASSTWTITVPMNTRRQAHTATLLANGRVMAAGGFAGSYLNSAELYDPNYALNPRISPTGAFGFSFSNLPGASFAVLTTTNLSVPLQNWRLIGGVMETSPGLFEFTDSHTTNGENRFYRVISQ